MQGQGMSGERRPVCEGRTHWRSGDKVADDGSNDTPRLSMYRLGVFEGGG